MRHFTVLYIQFYPGTFGNHQVGDIMIGAAQSQQSVEIVLFDSLLIIQIAETYLIVCAVQFISEYL